MLARRIFIAAVLIASLLPVSVQAKPNLSEWSNVQKLSVGTDIVVSTMKGERYEGALKHVDADGLLILVRVSRASRQAFELRREDVSEIRKSKSRALGMLLGFGVGLGVGLGIGAISDARHPYGDDPGIGKAVFGTLGATSGLAVGGAIPLKGKKIYVAP